MGLTFNGKTPESITIGGKAVASLSINGDIVWPEIQADYFYIQNKYNGSNTISLYKTGSPSTGSDISYSLDKETWNLCSNGTCSVTLNNVDDKIYFRSSTGFNENSSKYHYFYSSQNIKVGGNIGTLLNYTDKNLSSITAYGLANLFSYCIHLIDVSDMDFSKITNLASYCYNNMFKGCTALTTAPSLPATTLAGSCYNGMFYGCTSLTTAPTLSATTLANYCYFQMFYGCTALTTAPTLPATTLVDSCYRSMFEGCTSLTEAPTLPATTLVDSCYRSMFYGCTSLNKVITYAQNISASSCLTNWLSNVSFTGTFNKPFSTDYILGASGKPTSWTIRPLLESELSYQKIEVFTTFFRGRGDSSALPTWAFGYPTEIPSIYKENHSSIPSITIDSTTYNINAGSVSDTYLKSTNTDEKCGLYIEPASYRSSTGIALASAGFVINNPNNKNIKVSGHYAGYQTGTVSYFLYDRELNVLSSNNQSKSGPFTYTVTVDPYVNGIKIGYIVIQISHNPTSSGVRYKSDVDVEFVD